MKKFLLIGFIFLGVNSYAQLPAITEQAKISILTIGPSQEELYSAFGHSAIRVYDSIQNLDLFFNYGVFDFNQPHFYLNFARGNLNYKLEVYDFAPYRDYYVLHDRYIHEQLINLTFDQKQRIYNYLKWNSLPENQYYRYDYFYNNCATKVRDVFEQALKDEVMFDSTFIKTNYTIRNLTDLYLGQQPWGDLGIDICLGLPMDKKASPYEYMFLPDYIEGSFNHATNKITNTPLVSQTLSVYESEKEETPFHWFHPWIVLGVVFTIVAFITWRDWQKKKLSTWLDVILFLSTGAIGVLLFFLWTMTDHKAAAKNFNLLWALPTHAVVAFFLLKNSKPTWLSKYFLATTILAALLLGSWYLLPQALNVFLIPVVGMILIRGLVNLPQMTPIGTDGLIRK